MSKPSQVRRKALFITHEGFGNSIFQSQVIEHCETLEKHGISFDVLTYETFRKSWANSVKNLKKYLAVGKGRVTLKKSTNIYLPGSTFINVLRVAIDLLRLKRSNSYEFIHARADYTAFICVLLKPIHKLPVVWDCRGDAVDELEFSIEKFSWFFRTMLFLLLVPRQKFFRWFVSRFSTRCICVSEALKVLLQSSSTRMQIYVIPCPVPTEKFFFSTERRDLTRKRLEIEHDGSLFIYSGSMTGYQAIDDFLWFYRKIVKLPGSKLLIATTDQSTAKKIFYDFEKDNLKIITVEYKDMNDLYCAADFALMTRVPRSLNRVASPTKFGEYCLTGLNVIHNDSVDQVSLYSKKLAIGCMPDQWPPVRKSNGFREKAAESAKSIYGRNKLNLIYIECYDSLF